eukprot:CAMPEP_0205849114 /NCGR_PEP_ID=MMETSP1019-20131125/2745_1 /ASSEMBLY_ACC=CAM_ASM_000403 /TAXON_ID=46462 /ORGANISM="Anophryoides haemophila, Strain AH6" /LENGTH=41 /DNA_ID= /DNA_START= /DNA_END= /DNA_ORIENTATION=
MAITLKQAMAPYYNNEDPLVAGGVIPAIGTAAKSASGSSSA